MYRRNPQLQDDVLAMITTATHQPWALGVSIADLSLAGLKAESIVRMKLFTLDYSLIVRRIGHLGEADADEVMASMQKLFNFTLG
jgi:mRNA interferase MazF